MPDALCSHLKAEHREMKRLASVLNGIAGALHAGRRVAASDLAAALATVRDFSEACHCEAEGKAVFPALRKADPKRARVLLRELEARRRRSRGLVIVMEGNLPAAVVGEPGAASAWERAAGGYAAFLKEHVHSEDHHLIPLLKQSLPAHRRGYVAKAFDVVEAKAPAGARPALRRRRLGRLGRRYARRSTAAA